MQTSTFTTTKILRSDMLATKELDEHWRKTKANLVQSATLPFILFSKEGIDKGIKDPTFTKPDGVFRNKVSLNLRIKDGGKFGRLFIELFDDICPEACQYFVNLIKGDDDGYAYSRTKLFRIVPSLFCRGGDVEKNNGWGFYKIPDGTKAIADKSILRHTVPGVVSLVVNKDGELNGQFNIVFKPLPQFDGKHVVIGRIVSGPADALTRISAQGRSLGTVAADVVIEECGRYTESGSYTKGDPNTRKFPPLKKEKKFNF